MCRPVDYIYEAVLIILADVVNNKRNLRDWIDNFLIYYDSVFVEYACKMMCQTLKKILKNFFFWGGEWVYTIN